jgi:hypothetical protein
MSLGLPDLDPLDRGMDPDPDPALYLPLICQDRSENEVSSLERLNIEAKRTVLAYNLSRSKRKRIGLVKQFMRAKEKGKKVIRRSKLKQDGLVFNFSRMKQNEMEF